MKPPFPWNGAKTRMIETLCPYVSAWGGKGKWIEPFLGSGVVTREVRKIFPKTEMIVGDSNPWLIAAHQFWLSGATSPPTLEDVTPERVAWYRNLKDSDFENLSERDKALRFLVCLYSAWGNRWQTKDDGIFATPINTRRKGGDPEVLLRRLKESFGQGFFLGTDLISSRPWTDTVKMASPGDLVFLDSPYPETAGYAVEWSLKDWSEMYLWVKEAVGKGIHVLVCNPGTLAPLWGLVMGRSEEHFTPPQGRSTAPRVEYVGYHGPWNEEAKV